MKKNIIFILIILGLLAFNYDRLFSLFQKNEGSVLAKVNGEVVTLEEVEKLYDMRNVHLNTPAPDVERVQKEYAEILYERIKQILVAQELMKRNVTVDKDEMTAYENTIKKSYGEILEEGQSFGAYLAEYGIDYDVWIKQVRAQLENDKLHSLLLKEISPSTEETFQYAEKIKEQQQKDFSKIKFYKLMGNQNLLNEIQKDTTFSKEDVEKNGFSNKDFIHHFEKKGALVYEALFDSDSLPHEYKSILTAMNVNSFSAVHHEENTDYILYLAERKTPKEDDAVDLYLLAEEGLLQEKLPQAFADWLGKAIKNSDIYVVNSFKDVLAHMDNNDVNTTNDFDNISKLHDVLQEIKK